MGSTCACGWDSWIASRTARVPVRPGAQAVMLFFVLSCQIHAVVCRRLGVEHVALCGVQTPNCIRATAVDALGLDYKVVVLSDATASKNEQVQENNLEGTHRRHNALHVLLRCVFCVLCRAMCHEQRELMFDFSADHADMKCMGLHICKTDAWSV
eukprot:354762-Chlamydomonas_euryale.AAC.14